MQRSSKTRAHLCCCCSGGGCLLCSSFSCSSSGLSGGLSLCLSLSLCMRLSCLLGELSCLSCLGLLSFSFCPGPGCCPLSLTSPVANIQAKLSLMYALGRGVKGRREGSREGVMGGRGSTPQQCHFGIGEGAGVGGGFHLYSSVALRGRGGDRD